MLWKHFEIWRIVRKLHEASESVRRPQEVSGSLRKYEVPSGSLKKHPEVSRSVRMGQEISINIRTYGLLPGSAGQVWAGPGRSGLGQAGPGPAGPGLAGPGPAGQGHAQIVSKCSVLLLPLLDPFWELLTLPEASLHFLILQAFPEPSWCFLRLPWASWRLPKLLDTSWCLIMLTNASFCLLTPLYSSWLLFYCLLFRTATISKKIISKLTKRCGPASHKPDVQFIYCFKNKQGLSQKYFQKKCLNLTQLNFQQNCIKYISRYSFSWVLLSLVSKRKVGRAPISWVLRWE